MFHGRGILLELGENEDLVIDVKASILPKFLDTVDELSGEASILKGLILGEIKEDDKVLLEVKGLVISQFYRFEVLLKENVVLGEEVATYLHLALLLESSHLFQAQVVHLLPEFIVVGLLQFLAQELVVGHSLLLQVEGHF